jgi:hypothetical protein
VPAQTASPVGKGFTVSVDTLDSDAYDAIEAAGGFISEPDAGNQLVMIDVTVGYSGEEEPAGVGDLNFQIVGGTSAVGVDLYGCSGLDARLDSYNYSLLSGGVVSGAICGEVPTDDIAGMLLNVGTNYDSNQVFFDPAASPASATAVSGSSGPSADGDLTADRTAPIAAGTATDIDEGWTLTVNGPDADAVAAIAAVDFNDPAPAGHEYYVVGITLEYGGEDSASATAVDISVVGDSNVATRAGSCSVSNFDGELDRFSDVFSGGTLTGGLCFLVSSADVDSLQLLATTDFFGGEPDVFAIG